MKKLGLFAVFAVVVAGLVTTGLATTEVASAADPFVCPIVGDGVVNAAVNHDAVGLVQINTAAGTSLLPGNEQAGANSNPNAHNSRLPDDPLSGPGDGNSGFTASWSDNPGTPE